MSSHERGIDEIRVLARRAEQRLRLVRTLRVGAQAVCGALLFSLADVACRKLGMLGEGTARALLGGTGAALTAALLGAWAWPLPERAGARALDRFHGLHDRLASALSFSEDPRPTPFMA